MNTEMDSLKCWLNGNRKLQQHKIDSWNKWKSNERLEIVVINGLTMTSNIQRVPIYHFSKGIPDCIGTLRQMRQLNISFQGELALPESIGLLTNLKTLKVYKNCLIRIPKSIRFLEALELLDLSDNQLQDSHFVDIQLPTGLISLDLKCNLLTKIPDCVLNCVKLKDLDCTANQLCLVSKNLLHLTDLISLKIGKNRFDSYPDALNHCPSIQIDISKDLFQPQQANECKSSIRPLDAKVKSSLICIWKRFRKKRFRIKQKI
ncbi:hypothetical protein BC833DRAFT_567725 [Globomyces pollinis-pini]|nr:hypothetical protein BC833DRAFT_567725 [Globomyces pollinis-pini]